MNFPLWKCVSRKIYAVFATIILFSVVGLLFHYNSVGKSLSYTVSRESRNNGYARSPPQMGSHYLPAQSEPISWTSVKAISTGPRASARSLNASSKVEEVVQYCMASANLEHSLDVSASQRNARYLYDEYRKVIPQHSLPNHKSHCWKSSLYLSWSLRHQHIGGHIGNVTFSANVRKMTLQVPFILNQLARHFPRNEFKSDMVCLPNVFLAGFPKCGSTYFYCILNKLIDAVTKRPPSHHEAIKEPHFWARNFHLPSVQFLKTYLANFIPGLRQTTGHNRSMTYMVDATVNMFFKFPRFYPEETEITNYCLLPSVLPKLLPESKYLVIMRNPVKMMYSAFWFSCTSTQNELPMSLQLKGPDLFHRRVTEKLKIFNNCLRDANEPALNHTCQMDSKERYSSCVITRLHMLDTCIHRIAFNNFSPELAGCGRTRLAMGVYYVHLRKWLQVVARDRFHFLTLEDLVKDVKSVMQDLLVFLGLKVSSTSVFDEVLKYSCDTNSQSSVRYTSDPRLQMREDTKRLLDIFFHPFNQMLGTLINRTDLWTT